MRMPVAMLLFLLMNLANGQNGPSIQCPFRISCTQNKARMLELPKVPAKLLINYIDNRSQTLTADVTENCLSELFLKRSNLSFYPFELFNYDIGLSNITFFNCSLAEKHKQTYSNAHDMLYCPIYAVDPEASVTGWDLLSCTKLFDDVLPIDAYQIQSNSLTMSWSKTDFRCFECEHTSRKKHKSRKKPRSIILLATGLTVGSVVLLLVLIAMFQIYRYFRMKGEDHARVENFLKDYEAMKPTRFSYADVKRITNHFRDKLGEGAHGAVYKGKLSTEILVAVKILNNTEGDGKEFINEVGTMGKIHHVNVVRLLGFCADGFRRALVYDYFPNGSLQKYISPPNNNDNFLGWDKLQQIALGIVKGIEYLHQGCEHRILHFDINPHNVLLDESFTPKISDFGLAKLCSKNQSTVSMTAARGTLGYMAPEVFSRNFGHVSYKSDIYSYEMLLLEMVGEKKNINASQEAFQVLYPEWIHNLLEGGDIHVPIDDEGYFRIAKKLAVVGLWCIQWHPVHRPSMKTVIQMLEGEGDKLKVPPNPFGLGASTSTSATIPTRRLNLELEIIQELD